MTRDRFQNLLKGAIGLDANSIGASSVMRAVDRRARACRLADQDQYWDYLTGNPAELQELIEAVIVPETWFYRDREAFAVAVNLLREACRTRPAALPLRILSLPCSTGEEPYTIAMALLDAGIPPSAVRIEGIDVSNIALKHAKAGVYGKNSFRGADVAYLHRHFTQSAAGYRISDEVRSMVRFSQANLFELDGLADGEFDIVFCRNLLIYFDAADQRRASDVLRRRLAKAGTLFVGHSEASVLLREGFSPLRIPQAFAFRKSDSELARPPAMTVQHPANHGQRRASPPQSLNARPFAKPAPQPAGPISAIVRQAPTLDDIQRAADRGELGRALELGETMIAVGERSSEAFYLLAVISEAAGAYNSAADYYRRTLYLDPDHHEALSHLTLMLHRAGDVEGARRIEARARRLDDRKRRA